MTDQNATTRPVLCIDIGPTSQTVLFRLAGRDFADMPRLVLPAPSAIVSRRVAACTRDRRDIYLTGPAMGRECVAALANHARQGCRVAMEERTALGLYVTAENAAAAGMDILDACPDGYALILTDEVNPAFWNGFARMLALEEPPLVAVAAMDTGSPDGNATRGGTMHLWNTILRRHAENGAPVEAFMLSEVPASLPRLAALQAAVRGLVTDAGVAPLLGMLGDEDIRERSFRRGFTLVHAGEVHVTALLVWRGRVFGVYEQHTKKADVAKIAHDLSEFRLGWLPDEAVRADGGHGTAFADIPPEAEGFPATYIAGRERCRFAECGKLYEGHEDGAFTGCLGMASAVDAMAGNE